MCISHGEERAISLIARSDIPWCAEDPLLGFEHVDEKSTRTSDAFIRFRQGPGRLKFWLLSAMGLIARGEALNGVRQTAGSYEELVVSV